MLLGALGSLWEQAMKKIPNLLFGFTGRLRIVGDVMALDQIGRGGGNIEIVRRVWIDRQVECSALPGGTSHHIPAGLCPRPVITLIDNNERGDFHYSIVAGACRVIRDGAMEFNVVDLLVCVGLDVAQGGDATERGAQNRDAVGRDKRQMREILQRQESIDRTAGRQTVAGGQVPRRKAVDSQCRIAPRRQFLCPGSLPRPEPGATMQDDDGRERSLAMRQGQLPQQRLFGGKRRRGHLY
jgi:hypothetical protein